MPVHAAATVHQVRAITNNRVGVFFVVFPLSGALEINSALLRHESARQDETQQKRARRATADGLRLSSRLEMGNRAERVALTPLEKDDPHRPLNNEQSRILQNG